MKIAVVGSNRGIGLELVKKLQSDGHKVFAFCRSSSEALDKAEAFKIITDFEVTSLKQMSVKLKELHGEHLDLLIHVSGILKSDSLEDLSVENVMKQFEVNTVGPLLSAKAFKPYLKKGAKVVLVTSRMGSVEDNTSGGMYGYRMSKTALNMAGKGLAVDYKSDEITVLLMHPGYVQTEMTGHKGNMTAQESASKIVAVAMTKTLNDSGSFWHADGQQLPW